MSNKIFVTADLHFGHTNIIEYENRPFLNAEIMDRVMINNWNNVVGKRDTVFVLGDVSFYHQEKTTEIIESLAGRKILIKGNHDRRNNQWWVDVGFYEVSTYTIIYREKYVMQHYPPMYMNDAIPYFYIYGHVHGSEGLLLRKAHV